LLITLGAFQFLDGLVIASPPKPVGRLCGALEKSLFGAIELILARGRRRASLVKSKCVCLVDSFNSSLVLKLEPTLRASPKLCS
jgi:hypothetical protein